MTNIVSKVTTLAVIVLVVGPLAAVAQTVQNPSFEDDPVDPTHWTEYGDGATDDDARVYTPPTYAINEAFDGQRIYGAVKDGSRMSGGVYQRVAATTPGTLYRAQVWIFTQRTGNGEMRCRIGIDPTGGTDPGSSNLVWSFLVHSDGQWSQIQIDAQATASTITIFLAYSQSGSIGFAINYFDLVELVPDPPPPPPCTNGSSEVTLSDRRVDVAEQVEAQYAVPAGYVITGIGARGSAENVSTMLVRQAPLLLDGSLGEPEVVRFGNDPDGPIEALVLLGHCYVAVGYGARAAGEYDIFTLVVWARPILLDGTLGEVEEFRAGYDAYHPSLEREFLAETGRVLTGVGLRMQWSDITGIRAETDLYTATPVVTDPMIVIAPPTIQRSTVAGTNLSDDTFTVQNGGLGTLNYTITDDADWLGVSPESGTSTGEVDPIQISYDTAGLEIGTHQATITVTSPDATNSPETLAVTVEIIPVGPDFDGDGDVDQEDFGHFQVCLTGPGVPQTSLDCQDARLDEDEDVDQEDFAIFRGCMSGPDVPADPQCEGE